MTFNIHLKILFLCFLMIASNLLMNSLTNMSRTIVPQTSLNGSLQTFDFFETLHGAQEDANVNASIPSDAIIHSDMEKSFKPNVEFPEPTFLKGQMLAVNDEFAASWWMSRNRFMQVEPKNILNVEGDSFVPIKQAGKGKHDVRMAKDFLDFSIEHLSKCHKMFGTETGDLLMVRKCNMYVGRQRQLLDESQRKKQIQGSAYDEKHYLNRTILVIPYGVSNKTPIRKQGVWMSYLMATISSFLPHGPKRIVVVGYYEMDAKLAAQAFSELMPTRKPVYPDDALTNTTYHIASSELAYVRTTDVESKWVKENVPKGALAGLKEALLGKQPHNVTGSFLGNHQPTEFDHIYMTESDQILTARFSPVFWSLLDENLVLVPHRLQPVPHPKDVAHIDTQISHMLQRHDFVDIDDAQEGACCDDPSERGPKCSSPGVRWWQCGYYKGNFSMFDNFQFMTLSDSGTGIVLLGSNQHGRKCIPKPRGRGTCN